MTDNRDAALAAVQKILGGLVVAALEQDEEKARIARAEALEGHRILHASADEADATEFDIDGLWNRALMDVESPDLLGDALRVSPTLPKSCPVALDELMRPGLALQALEDRIRKSAPTG